MSEQKDKNAILQAAQNDKSRGKELENREGIRSNIVGLLAALGLGCILFLIELFEKKTWNIALVAVFLVASGTSMLYEGIKIKSVWRIILGSVQLVFALLFSLGFVGQVIA